MAVSQTRNPLGKYVRYHVPASSRTVAGCGGRDCFPDYPRGGYDAAAFYITADLFTNPTNGPFVEAGASFTEYRFDDRPDYVVQPSLLSGAKFADRGPSGCSGRPRQAITDVFLVAGRDRGITPSEKRRAVPWQPS